MLLLQRSCRVLCTAVLVGIVSGCDFISPTESNPNAVPDATLDQLLVGVSVNNYFLEEGQSARLAAMWLQQMAGTDRQFSGFDKYTFTESDASASYASAYTGGGLIDIRTGIAQAEADGRRVYAGIFKVYEALMIGMAASIFGDVEYSEAVSPDIAEPVLDPQRSVYDAVLSLLDEAILDLRSGEGIAPSGADFVYGGDVDAWIAAANTIKARFNMHWVEVDGSSRYAEALAAAQQGIMDATGDFVADHSTSATENNLWFQFLRDRSGYISAGAFLVNELWTRNDPRLTLYYGPGSGAFADTIIGSPPGNPTGDPGSEASSLAVPGYGAGDFDFPILTCAESNFIIAEAELQGNGDAIAARAALDAALACEETRKGVDLTTAKDANDALVGSALFDEIMMQKYISLFLNREIWNDYKRTCYPAVVPFGGLEVPARLYYDDESRETNTNIPDPGEQPQRNANDPGAC